MKRKMTSQKILILAGVVGSGLLLSSCADPAARQARIEAEDHQNCLELGFKPGTESYGNCRLKLREIRARQGGSDSNVRFGIGVGVGSAF